MFRLRIIRTHTNFPINPYACFNKNQNNNIAKNQMNIVKQSSAISLSPSKHHYQPHHNTKNKSTSRLVLNQFLEVDRHIMAKCTRCVRCSLAMCA